MFCLYWGTPRLHNNILLLIVHVFTDQMEYKPGADPGIWERGGTTHCFFLGPPPASKLAEVPKKLISGGGGGGWGDSDTFFRSAIYVESRASSNRGIGGRNQTPFFFFRFQKEGGGAHVQKGGAFIEKCVKRGARAGCAPPKSATGINHQSTPNSNFFTTVFTKIHILPNIAGQTIKIIYSKWPRWPFGIWAQG